MGLGDWPAARKHFLRAIEQQSGDHRAQFGLGLALEKLGDLPRAAAAYQTAQALAPREERISVAAGLRRVTGKTRLL